MRDNTCIVLCWTFRCFALFVVDTQRVTDRENSRLPDRSGGLCSAKRLSECSSCWRRKRSRLPTVFEQEAGRAGRVGTPDGATNRKFF